MTTVCKPPHHTIAERLIEALGVGDIEYARLEFPAALVPLREGLEPEDDDMIAIDFVVDENDRILATVSYTDFTSDEFEDSADRIDWTLFDARGVASLNVLFHDVDDAAAWIKEHGVLTLAAWQKDEAEVEAAYRDLVSELIMIE